MKRKKPDANFKFYVGSLLHANPSEYVAVCNQFGEITGHLYNGELKLKEQEAEELIEETKNPLQISLF